MYRAEYSQRDLNAVGGKYRFIETVDYKNGLLYCGIKVLYKLTNHYT